MKTQYYTNLTTLLAKKQKQTSTQPIHAEMKKYETKKNLKKISAEVRDCVL